MDIKSINQSSKWHQVADRRLLNRSLTKVKVAAVKGELSDTMYKKIADINKEIGKFMEQFGNYKLNTKKDVFL